MSGGYAITNRLYFEQEWPWYMDNDGGLYELREVNKTTTTTRISEQQERLSSTLHDTIAQDNNVTHLTHKLDEGRHIAQSIL
jgi:hypothetical protein